MDSARFGLAVARADDVTAEAVPELLEFCAARRIDLLIARCDGGDQAAGRALTGAGLVMLEAMMNYRGPLAPGALRDEVREARPDDAPELERLAREGFADYNGHYHADPRLPREACREIYVDWTLRGLAGEGADVVFVAELDRRVAAYGLFTIAGELLQFQLSSAAAWARGHQLYNAILDQGMAWGLERGAREVLGVVAHSTTPAHRNLVRAGLRPVSSFSTYHGWRDQLAL
jgi:hypothetical protein